MKRSFVIETAGLALVNLIPTVGGSIGSVISNLQAERKAKRVQEFLEKLDEDFKLLKEQVNQDYISQDDFLDIFEHTAINIANQRSELKREAIRNNFLKGMLASEVDYDRVEVFERLIDLLSEGAIELLLALNNPSKYNLPENFFDPIYLYSVESMIESVFPQMPKTKIADCLIHLESQGLITTMTMSGYPEDVSIGQILKGQLTKRGVDFSSYISGNKQI